MKIMAASDIHGSSLYCRQMLDAFAKEQADRLLLLGDLLYHGPRNDLPEGYAPKEVIPLLNAHKNSLLCVRGNCDTEVDQMVLEFPILAESCILWLGSRMVYATHGHHFNTSCLPPLQPGDILLHGHTHVPAWEGFCVSAEVSGMPEADVCKPPACLYLNPGSVSIPKKNSPRGYLILTEREAEWKTLEGKSYHKILL
ncbi:MAG TPA: phosphodiesterase [Candidatus Eisenbergiella merdavium]|uniref:Phosphoesterase n=1 Tax=Candidatus Eisenbergiella merdavium TaxID=2838551 RepID=A0A9D2NH47_9FIRM|nr:phosphodiesterase [Candidatus Eisenbergiella merdavium]